LSALVSINDVWTLVDRNKWEITPATDYLTDRVERAQLAVRLLGFSDASSLD